VIHALNRPTVNELANFLELSQPNMTYKVASLVKKGYVRKVPSKLDKRKTLLEVTDKFYHYYNLKNEYVEEVLSRLSSRISSEKLMEFEEVLTLMSIELMPEVSNFINVDRDNEQ
ncbi:MAG: MarR family transcriptional regulator, partial [Bacillota bacterium]|nr:MarR family transcriptional regulator [Bacillota bacterium]